MQGHHPDGGPNSLSRHSHHPLRGWVLELLLRTGLGWEEGIRDGGEPSCHLRVRERCHLRERELLEGKKKNLSPGPSKPRVLGQKARSASWALVSQRVTRPDLAGWVPAGHPARSSFSLDLRSWGERSAQPRLQALGLSVPQLTDRDMLSVAAGSLARRLGFLWRRVALPDWARRR